MRVLHVTPYYRAAWAQGGIPRVVAALAPALAARGHEVTVATTDLGDGTLPLPSGRTRERGVDCAVFPNLSGRLAHRLQLFLPRGLAGWLEREVAGFDLVHIHACHNLPGALAARAARRRGVPYVVQPNGTAPRIERRRLAKLLFDATFGRGLLAGAAKVLAVSPAERGDLERLGVLARRLRIVPNPLAGEGSFARAPRGERVVFLGRMSPRKRLDLVVAAFARLPRPRARLVLAGNDAGGLAPALALARRLGVLARIDLPGLLAGAARLELLGAASVIVYPGEREVFGLVAFEALAQGTPVVVAGDSGAGEWLALVGGGTIVPAGDAPALARAMDGWLARGEAGRREAREAGRRALARFAPERVAAEVEAVYREAVA